MHHQPDLLDLPTLQINLHSTFVIKKTVLPKRIPFRRHNIENKSVCRGVTRTRKRFKCHFLCYFTNRCGDILYVPFLVTSSLSDAAHSHHARIAMHENGIYNVYGSVCLRKSSYGSKTESYILDKVYFIEMIYELPRDYDPPGSHPDALGHDTAIDPKVKQKVMNFLASNIF